MAKDKSAAVVTIFKPGMMTKMGRARLAIWLRGVASDFARYGDRYSETRFTARLYR